VAEEILNGEKMGCAKEDRSALYTCIGKSQELVSLVEYSDDSIVSKTILDTPAGTITLFAFDKGQKLSEHTAPYNAVVQIIDGSAHLTIGGESLSVPAGHVIIMPANVPHSVVAKEKFKMLLTMIRA
jgi:quercetin dioxygenase-like cupin family protein